MLYEAEIFWRTDKNIQVKLYFIPVVIIIELGNFAVMSIITGVSCKDRKETYTQHEFCAKTPGVSLYMLPHQHGMMQHWKEILTWAWKP